MEAFNSGPTGVFSGICIDVDDVFEDYQKEKEWSRTFYQKKIHWAQL